MSLFKEESLEGGRPQKAEQPHKEINHPRNHRVEYQMRNGFFDNITHSGSFEKKIFHPSKAVKMQTNN